MRNSLALAVFGILFCATGAAKADGYILPDGHVVHACVSRASLEKLVDVTTTDDYFDALAGVAAYEEGPCPERGPFADNTLPGETMRSTENMRIIRWRYQGSRRNYYTLLLQVNGVWYDTVNFILESRTADGVSDFIDNLGK